MKTLGDISPEDKELAVQLEEAERKTDADTTLPNDRKAQSYVCLAHDWYVMDMEEEGNRLLLKAQRVFPGYFSSAVIQHQEENENFSFLVKRITVKLLILLAGSKQ